MCALCVCIEKNRKFFSFFPIPLSINNDGEGIYKKRQSNLERNGYANQFETIKLSMIFLIKIKEKSNNNRVDSITFR